MSARIPREPIGPLVRVYDMLHTSTIEVTVGDLAADARTVEFAELYRSARPSIGRALALALGDVDLAAEATDEAFARAYERWARVSTLERPEGWIYRVGLNWATSVLRRRRNQHRLYTEAVPISDSWIDPAVHASIAALDVDHRAVVVCRHLLGWSVRETAEALRIREGTVKSRLHRAMKILESRLAHLDPSRSDER